MLNKKGEKTTVEFTVSLVITIIVLVVFASCGYKLFNPNCDPSSIDVFNDFIKYYEECEDKEEDCEKFDYSGLSKNDNIIVKPAGIELENTLITLNCNGKDSFRFRKQIEDVKLCLKSKENKILFIDDSESTLIEYITLHSDENIKWRFAKDNYVNLHKVDLDKICFLLIGELEPSGEIETWIDIQTLPH